MKHLVIVAALLAACVASAQQATNPAPATLRILMPASIDPTQVRITSVAQPMPEVWVLTMAYDLRQNLAGRIGVDCWVTTHADIHLITTKTEIATLLGVAPSTLAVVIPVGALIPIPPEWAPAFLKKVGIALSPTASARYPWTNPLTPSSGN